MRISYFVYLLVLATLLIIPGCEFVPSDALQSAKEKLSEAELAEANFYVGDVYRAASDSLMAAETEIQAQKTNSFWARDYVHAKRLIQSASDLAEQSILSVDGAKEALAIETTSLFADTEATIEKANEIIASQNSANESPVTVAGYVENASAASLLLTEAQAAFDAGTVYEAHSKAKEALAQANALLQKLSQHSTSPAGL